MGNSSVDGIAQLGCYHALTVWHVKQLQKSSMEGSC